VDLWEISLKTGALQRLTDHPASDWDPFITLDNQHLVWCSNRSGNFEIWIGERDGSSSRQVSHDGFDAENLVVTPVSEKKKLKTVAAGRGIAPGLRET
jgi:Tol biopolymer transport system component